MKFLIIILFLVPVVACADKFDDSRKAAKETAISFQSLPDYTCFRDTYVHSATQPWEVAHTWESKAYMLVRKSGDALLIAQPSTHCEDELDESKCNYWLRTVKVQDPYLIDAESKVVKCPAHLTKKFMDNYIKSRLSNKIKLN